MRQAVLAASERTGVLTGPFEALPEQDRDRAIESLLEPPEAVGLINLRALPPSVGRLRRRHQLDILGLEALAAALHLEADVYLSTASPRHEDALEREGRRSDVLA